MTGQTLFSSPCDGCDAFATEAQTGAGYCRRSPLGDCECETAQTVAHLEEIAGQMAVVVQRVHDRDMRRQIAESAVDGFENALFVADLAVRLDDRAFYSACDVTKKARVAA